VDFAVHVSDASDKGAEPKGLPFDGKNPHAHVLVGMRGFNAAGTWHHYKNGGKDRPWNQYSAENKRFESMRPWRDAWEEMQNRHLAAAGSFARVSLQSYAARGIDQIPTVHMGYEEWQQHQQGLDTDTGRRNQEIREENARRQADRENAPTAAANDNRVTAHTRDSVRAPEKDAGRRSAPPPPSRETPDAQAQRAAHAASPDRETARDGPDARAGVEDRQPQAPPRRTGQQGAAGHAQRRWMADTMAGWQRYWERQAERLERYQAAFDGKALYAKLKGAFARGKTAEKESPEEKEKEEARQKPRRVWSAEQRADYQMLRPYLQQHADLSKKEQAHLQAVVMHYAQQKRAQERRVELERIARQQAAFRQRAITQDRPLPHQARERTRGRGR
jgi:hypothetical protein